MKKLVLLLFILLSLQLFSDSISLPMKDLKKIFKTENIKLEKLEQNKVPDLKGAFYKIKKGKENYYLFSGRVDTYRGNGQNQNQNGEFFEYFILYDQQKNIQKVKITNYSAAHGEMICSKAWLDKFIGYNPSKPLEIGRQVDAISGATLSVNKITFDIKQKSYILTNYIN